MPHLGHVIFLAIVEVMAGVLTGAAIGVLTISSRSGSGKWCPDGYRHRPVGSVVTDVGAGVHTVRDINPGVPANLKAFVASELTQAGPQSVCLKDVATKNI